MRLCISSLYRWSSSGASRREALLHVLLERLQALLVGQFDSGGEGDAVESEFSEHVHRLGCALAHWAPRGALEVVDDLRDDAVAVDRVACAADDRLAVRTGDSSVEFHRHHGGVVRTATIAGCDVDEPGEGVRDLFWGRENLLDAHDGDRVILALVLAGDVVEAARGDRDERKPIRPGRDLCDRVAIAVAQHKGEREVLLGETISSFAPLHVGVHVDDVNVEASPEIGNQDKSRVPVRVGQDLTEPGVEDAGTALVCGEYHDGFSRTDLGVEPFENHFGDAGACATVVAGGSSFVQILSPGVETFVFGDLGGSLERVPREVEYVGIALATGVNHVKCDVVAGVHDARGDDGAFLLGQAHVFFGGTDHAF